jgi:probable addiction module antidote protein
MSSKKKVVADKVDFDLDKIKAFPKFDTADYLDSPEMLAAYLTEAFSERSIRSILECLGTAARSKGMPEVASEVGIARESLYKALRPDGQPRLDTVLGVLEALGMQIIIQPASDQSQEADDEDDEDDGNDVIS